MSIEYAIVAAVIAAVAGVGYIERTRLKSKLAADIAKIKAEAVLEAEKVKAAAEAEAKQLVKDFTSGVTAILHKIYNEGAGAEKAVVAKIKEELAKI